MKKVLVYFCLILTFIFTGNTFAQNTNSSNFAGSSTNIDKTNRQPILLELFTAEGCYNCPPAEKMLATLDAEQPFEKAELITLAFHVDYWDDSGWKDKFASPLFSQRQRVYDRKFLTGSIYTPQMIVDGDIEFIGSKMDKAEKAIEKAVKNEKADIAIEVLKDKVKIKITNIPKHEASSIYLAIAEDGLNSSISSGYNKGKELNHVSVVRELKGLGRVFSQENSFEIETNLQIRSDWKRENLRLVVFIQENRKRNIIGVGQIKQNKKVILNK